MPDVEAALEHCKWLISHGRGKEPAKLVLPRIERQKRVANKEQRTRVQFDCTPEEYSEWHKEFKRYIESCRNHSVIARSIMLRLLQQLPDSSIAKLAEDDTAAEKETLGDA
jgi:hypothetical protein